MAARRTTHVGGVRPGPGADRPRPSPRGRLALAALAGGAFLAHAAASRATTADVSATTTTTAPAAAVPTEAGEVWPVIAAYLVKFAQKIEWTDAALPPGAPLRIGVLGDDPFGPVLDQMLSGKQAGGHPLVALRGRTAAELAGCHVVFVADHRAFAGVLRQLAGQPVATVTYSYDRFSASGCTIELVLVKQFPRFILNVGAMKAQGLTYDRALWDLAHDRKPGPVLAPAARPATP